MAVIRLPNEIFTGDYSDVVTPVSGDNGKSLVWNQTAQRAEWASVAASPGGSSGQVQYANAGAFAGHSGFVYDGAGKVTLSSALVVPIVCPPVDSIAAWKVTKANGATAVVTVDTTNSRVGVNMTPASPYSLDITGNARVADNSYLAVGEIRFLGYSFATFGGNPGNGAPYAGYNLAWDKGADNRLELAANGKMSGWSATTDGLVFYCGDNTGVTGAVPTIRVRVEATGTGFGLVGTTALVDIGASTASAASLRIRSGTAPTSPNDGDIWFDGTNYKCRIGGVTKTFTVT